jgi:hypothetical protein
MLAIRLESFDVEQIGLWLAIWNEENSERLATRGLRALPTVEALKHHRSLASQPLLLMMLALYDADDNALQRQAETFAGFEFYESLLRGFAEREVRKSGAALTDDALTLAVEHELTRLSAVAFATFNRNRQWTTESELTTDLPAFILRRSAECQPGRSGQLRARHPAAETDPARPKRLGSDPGDLPGRTQPGGGSTGRFVDAPRMVRPAGPIRWRA